MALSWTHSNRSMSFLCQGPQTTSSQINSCFTYVLSEALHKPVYLNYSLFTIKLFTIHYLNTEIQLIINTRIWQWEELHDYKALRNSKCFSYVTIKKKNPHTLWLHPGKRPQEAVSPFCEIIFLHCQKVFLSKLG